MMALLTMYLFLLGHLDNWKLSQANIMMLLMKSSCENKDNYLHFKLKKYVSYYWSNDEFKTNINP